jgi:hypothetical protein
VGYVTRFAPRALRIGVATRVEDGQLIVRVLATD